MKTTFLIVLALLLSTPIFGTAIAAFCPQNGYCYFLEGDGMINAPQNFSLAAIFNPTDAPEVIFTGLFNFLLGFVGIGAVVMIVIEGIRYMASAGDQSKIGESKRKIWNAVWGLIIALLSYILLQAINPDLLKPGLKSINLQKQENLLEPGFNKQLNNCLYNQSAADCEQLKKKECSKPVSGPEDPSGCYCVQNPGNGICQVNKTF